MEANTFENRYSLSLVEVAFFKKPATDSFIPAIENVVIPWCNEYRRAN